MKRARGRQKKPVVWFLCCFVFYFLPFAWCAAAEYEQKQGCAVVRLEADKIGDGRVSMRLSDALRLTVTVEGGPALEVQPPEGLTTPGDWEVERETGPEKISLGGGRVRWQERFRLSPVKPGELSLALSPLRFRSSSDAEHWNEVAWRPIPVQVSTEVYRPDLSELRDIAPPEELPPAPSWTVPLTWTGLAIVSVLLLLSGWTLLRRRGSRNPPLPPGEWALRELARVGLPAEATEWGIEQFYTRLSDVLRRYLELRYHLPAPEQTTAEFLEEMRRSPQLQPEQQAVLRQFLERCDLVKFARAQPSLNECREAAEMARAFVEQTASDDESKTVKAQRL